MELTLNNGGDLGGNSLDGLKDGCSTRLAALVKKKKKKSRSTVSRLNKKASIQVGDIREEYAPTQLRGN